MVKLSENLIKYRKEASMSQADLAEKIFVTPQAVSRWERGITEPDLNTLEKIAKVLNVSLDELIEGNGGLQAYKFQRLAHVVYLIGSIIMIVFSFFLITTYFWKAPVALYFTFIGCALAFLITILVFEILKEIESKKNEKPKEDLK